MEKDKHSVIISMEEYERFCGLEKFILDKKEGKEYLKWCLKHGYKELYSAPDWDEYLKIKNNNK